MIKLFFVFVFLQAADLATTVLTLKLGGVEQNPLIQFFLTVGPVFGLVLAKIIVLLIAAGCAAGGRERPLRCANLAFTGIVSWNLFIIARLLS